MLEYALKNFCIFKICLILSRRAHVVFETPNWLIRTQTRSIARGGSFKAKRHILNHHMHKRVPYIWSYCTRCACTTLQMAFHARDLCHTPEFCHTLQTGCQLDFLITLLYSFELLILLGPLAFVLNILPRINRGHRFLMITGWVHESCRVCCDGENSSPTGLDYSIVKLPVI